MSNFSRNPYHALPSADPFEYTNLQAEDSWTSPPPYSPFVAHGAQAGAEYLNLQQEELERKVAEMDQREQMLHATEPPPRTYSPVAEARVNNFPPLPSFCCMKPCIYHDISKDIPRQYQRIVKANFCHYFALCLVMFLNVWVSAAYYGVSKNHGISNSSRTNLVFAILSMFLLLVVGFICDFRPVYNAFRTRQASFFIMFFINFSIQCVSNILRGVGLNRSGTVGYFTGVELLSEDDLGLKVTGVVMVIIGVLFTLLAVSNIILIILVMYLFRTSDFAPFRIQETRVWGYIMNGRSAAQTTTEDTTTSRRSDVAPLTNGSNC